MGGPGRCDPRNGIRPCGWVDPRAHGATMAGVIGGGLLGFGECGEVLYWYTTVPDDSATGSTPRGDLHGCRNLYVGGARSNKLQLKTPQSRLLIGRDLLVGRVGWNGIG